jgi:hypothetical protein
MHPNVLTRVLRKRLTSGQSWIPVEYLLVYAWHSSIEEQIILPNHSRTIITSEWLTDALGAINATSSASTDCFEDLMVYGCTTAAQWGLNIINGTPGFLARAEEGLLCIQRANGVIGYNEARRRLRLRPYTDLHDLVRGTTVPESEMRRLFQSVENVDFYTGIRMDNTKEAQNTPSQSMCDVVRIVIGSLALGLLPFVHGALQPTLPPCIQQEVNDCKKNGFLSTLLHHHVRAFRNASTHWRFDVL